MNKNMLKVAALALLPAMCGIAKADEAQEELPQSNYSPTQNCRQEDSSSFTCRNLQPDPIFRGYDLVVNLVAWGPRPDRAKVTNVGRGDIVVRPIQGTGAGNPIVIRPNESRELQRIDGWAPFWMVNLAEDPNVPRGEAKVRVEISQR